MTAEAAGHARSDEGSLSEVLDRLLAGGLVVEGDLILSIADVDLVWLGLRAVAGSVSQAPPHLKCASSSRPRPHGCSVATAVRDTPQTTGRRIGRSEPDGRPVAGKVSFDGERVERGLVRLVMSLVELVRDLMERQALRRLDDEGLSEDQIEELGLTLMRLGERVEELKTHFGLEGEDLNLSLAAISEER